MNFNVKQLSNKQGTELISSIRCTVIFICIFVVCTGTVFSWQIKKAPIMTKWSMVNNVMTLDTSKIFPDYPRPTMERPLWENLNGIWKLKKAANNTETFPASTVVFPDEILVPYPVESAISGVMSKDYQFCWYRKDFTIPAAWLDGTKKILIHFDAVDYQTEVFMNGTSVGTHLGGYDRFSFDVTQQLANGGQGNQQVTLRVYDPTDRVSGWNPTGKQRYNPSGIFYTPSTGIWRTVWLEAVSKTAYINYITLVPDVDNSSLKVTVQIAGDVSGAKVYAFAKDAKGSRKTWGGDSATAAGTTNLTIKLSAVNLWWPDRPFLHNLGIYIKKSGAFVDSVQSYFGMRKIEMTAVSNIRRIHINGKPVFVYTTLDQGFWPDGIYTAPTYEALRYDLEMHKQYGFNGIRKHIKIEPDRWFYYCDSLGLLVEQDMVGQFTGNPTTVGKENYARELDSLIIQHYNFPCIFMWTTWNEGWGMSSSDYTRMTTIVQHVKTVDPTRLVNAMSGGASGYPWNGSGDVKDDHTYPDPGRPGTDSKYVVKDGEYGGVRLNTADMDAHEWNPTASWGYSDQTSQAGFESKFYSWAQSVASYKTSTAYGIAGAVYTQITDVETECNGLMTYDRAISKGRPAEIKKGIELSVDHPTVAAIVPATGTIDGSFWDAVSIVNDQTVNTRYRLHMAKAYTSGNAITVVLNGANAESLLRIINTRGQKIIERTVIGSGTITMPTNGLAKGLCIVELVHGDVAQRIRCIVK